MEKQKDGVAPLYHADTTYGKVHIKTHNRICLRLALIIKAPSADFSTLNEKQVVLDYSVYWAWLILNKNVYSSARKELTLGCLDVLVCLSTTPQTY